MPTANLSDTWIYAGKTYLPGTHKDMPQEVYDALKGKGAFTEGDEAAVPKATPSPWSTDADRAVLDTTFGVDTASQLALAGFASVQAVRDASDDDLLAVEGIGPATLRKIRAALQE